MKQKNLVLMVVAVGCGLVAAFLTTQINAKPKVEMVKVLVASKDLAVGTMLTEAEYDKLVVTKDVSKDSLPPQFATTKEEIVGKRLSRPVLKDETFAPGALTKGGVVTLPEGMDMISLPMSAGTAAGGFVGPGSKVDILAGLRLGNQLKTFPLLVDMHVLAVNQHVSYDRGTGAFPDMTTVSFAATQEEALLLTLAKQRGCALELLLRHPGKPKDLTYDLKKIRKMLEDEQHPVKTVTTGGDGKSGDGDVTPWNPPTAAPAPNEKTEYVRVWVAKGDLPANTTITADLVREKFVEQQRPKQYAEDACSDLSVYYTKALKHGVAKGQYVTGFMLGEQALKPGPQDLAIDGLPKPGPNDPVKPDPVRPDPTAPVVLPTRDITFHTPSGSRIARYVEVQPGEWKLWKMLTPEEAARPPKAERPTSPPKPPVAPATPDAKPVD
jgi:pilus assembly protein CpaB